MTIAPEVRVATFEELPARTAYYLWQLRSAVFVVEQSCVFLDLDSQDGQDGDPTTRHLWIEEGGKPIAALRIHVRPELDDDARVTRVIVAPAHRGRRLGDALMATAVELIGDRPSVLMAQSHLAHWYSRFGYAVDGEEFVEDGILHTPMRRVTDGTATPMRRG